MKVYPFIVIDKSNMTTLRHYVKAEQVADMMMPKFDVDRFVIVKNETKVLNMDMIKYIGGDMVSRHNAVLNLLRTL